MKKLFVNVCVLTLVAAIGCDRSATEVRDSATPASTGTTGDAAPTAVQKPVAGEADYTFSLSVPFESVALVQGGKTSVRIGINRGDNFGEQVQVKVTGLPKGVSVEADQPVITPGSTGLELMLVAADDAALGDFTAQVTGETASSGPDFTEEFKLTVSQE
jgi:hypothetical protein